MKRIGLIVLALLLALSTVLVSACKAPPTDKNSEENKAHSDSTEASTAQHEDAETESTANGDSVKEEETALPEASDSSNEDTNTGNVPEHDGTVAPPETEPVEPPVDVIQQPVPPAEGVLDQIAKDYYYHSLESHKGDPNTLGKFYVYKYYGTYDGAAPVIMQGTNIDYATEICEETVAGYTFIYPCYNLITVWKDGEFYSLQEAYDLGILTEEQIGQIANVNFIKYDMMEYGYPK